MRSAGRSNWDADRRILVTRVALRASGKESHCARTLLERTTGQVHHLVLDHAEHGGNHSIRSLVAAGSQLNLQREYECVCRTHGILHLHENKPSSLQTGVFTGDFTGVLPRASGSGDTPMRDRNPTIETLSMPNPF